MDKVRFEQRCGADAKAYVNELAKLRITVFREFPYLYDGDLGYEKKYLDTYFRSEQSLVILCFDDEVLVGASTCIPMSEEEESFQRPFIEKGYEPNEILYFGESILLPQYRGTGIGKRFVFFREEHAKRLGKKLCVFCAVVRGEEDTRRPSTYRSPERLWNSQGFRKMAGVTTHYSWKQIDETGVSPKLMQFWAKSLE